MSVSLSLEGVSKTFGSRKVISGLSFRVEAPGVLGVSGSNGSGKTTLLRLIAGLQPSSSGMIRLEVGGTGIDASRRAEFIRMVSPELALYGTLTAFENLSFFATMNGMNTSRREQAELLERVGLDGRGPDRVDTYSSGMKQRLKYAVALLNDPAVLLLDEPMANLDESGKAIVTNVINEQRQQRILIIATNEAEDLRDVEQTINLDN